MGFSCPSLNTHFASLRKPSKFLPASLFLAFSFAARNSLRGLNFLLGRLHTQNSHHLRLRISSLSLPSPSLSLSVYRGLKYRFTGIIPAFSCKLSSSRSPPKIPLGNLVCSFLICTIFGRSFTGNLVHTQQTPNFHFDFLKASHLLATSPPIL